MRETPVSAISRTFSSVTPPLASSRARPPTRATIARSSADRAVVEQQEVGAGFDGGDRVGFGFDLDLDPQAGGRRGARGLDGERDAAGQGDVVVLEQDAVVEPDAVIEGPADRGRVLVEGAPARERLARVDDARAGALDRRHETPGGAGDAAQPPEKVERGALGREDGAQASRDEGERLAGLGQLALAAQALEAQTRDRPPRRRPRRSASPQTTRRWRASIRARPWDASATTSGVVTSPGPRSSARARSSSGRQFRGEGRTGVALMLAPGPAPGPANRVAESIGGEAPGDDASTRSSEARAVNDVAVATTSSL